MPIYTLPEFNLLAKLWLNGRTQAFDPPDYEDVPCQKYIPSRNGGHAGINWNFSANPPVILRFPRDVPFDTGLQFWSVNFIEVPSGSSQFYSPYFWEVMHEGFVNEYATLWSNQCSVDGQNFAPLFTPKFLNNPSPFPFI